MPAPMPKPSPDAATGASTRERLLDIAAECFAEHGYAGTRVRDIARRAGANLAAINYHFGGKQALYLDVLRSRAQARIERYPLPEPVPLQGEAAAAETQLEAAIAALIGRVLASDATGQLPRLLMRELATPTEALPVLAQDLIAPQFLRLRSIVAELLGSAADDAVVSRCTFSVVGQCLFYLFARPLLGTLAPGIYAAGAEITLARHLTQFSLGAIRALRTELESRDDKR